METDKTESVLAASEADRNDHSPSDLGTIIIQQFFFHINFFMTFHVPICR